MLLSAKIKSKILVSVKFHPPICKLFLSQNVNIMYVELAIIVKFV